MSSDPSKNIRKNCAFGEFGGVNPSITDSFTYIFVNKNSYKIFMSITLAIAFLTSSPTILSMKHHLDNQKKISKKTIILPKNNKIKFIKEQKKPLNIIELASLGLLYLFFKKEIRSITRYHL